jgi:hypothetical protein
MGVLQEVSGGMGQIPETAPHGATPLHLAPPPPPPPPGGGPPPPPGAGGGGAARWSGVAQCGAVSGIWPISSEIYCRTPILATHPQGPIRPLVGPNP